MEKEIRFKIFEGTELDQEQLKVISGEQLDFLLSREYAQARTSLEENFEHIIPEMKKEQYPLAQEYITRAKKYNDIIKKVLPSLDKGAMLNELIRSLGGL